MMEIIEYGWGLDLIVWFQSWRTPFVAALFAPFNYLAKEWVYLVFFPFLYWSVNKSFGRRFMLLALFSAWVNVFFKNLWMRPRPFQVEGSPVKPYFDYSDSYGLPSGHAQSGATLAGYPALVFRRNWTLPVALLFSLLMALSRMVHGVHYPQDVVVGLILGWGLVLMYYALEKRGIAFFRSLRFGTKLGFALGSGFVLAGLYLIFPLDSHGFSESLTLGGVLSGGGVGLVLEDRYIGFNDSRSWKNRLFRFLLGLGGLLIIYAGLKGVELVILSGYEEGSVLSFVLRYLRYFTLGCWVTFLAPRVFLALKLAEQGKTA
jgi:membrane-associated phospholipid phosphatase